MKNLSFLSVLCSVLLLAGCKSEPMRKVLNLNGQWEIAKTDGEPATQFSSVTAVPGLVDLAVPALDEPRSLYLDGWYWHRRGFTLASNDYDKIELKIFKAKYHTKVYVNGKLVGENPFCFTPSYFDIKPFLKPAGEENEIMIGVGNRSALPDSIPDGGDFEKLRYIPGIYDNVEITLSGKPYIVNIQTVPDIVNGKLRVVAELDMDSTRTPDLRYTVREAASGKRVAKGKVLQQVTTEGGISKVDFTIEMKDAELWSPDSPFLYELTLSTGADDKTVRFGMRSYRADIDRRIMLLNEKPYHIKGTNVCIFRFFEDPERDSLPWNKEWATTLHERFKDMHWDAIRYCIGFPPEFWYDTCDSLGILLQDEFPFWTSIRPEKKPGVTPAILAEEYRRWMRERWNHPSVVIWDAQNESVNPKTGAAIKMVRDLDLSDRPWENGWSEPDRPTDVIESHPYLFIKYVDQPEAPEGYKREFFDTVRRPDNDAASRLPYMQETGRVFDNLSLINEYGWIWLNRNGSPTTLTDKVYQRIWNADTMSSEERFDLYARHLAMLTEYWRAHRQARVGIMHFCGLGYSRPGEPRGQTSDHWIDLQNLVMEPHMYKYLKPAFSPVGLMVELWEKEYKCGATITVPVFVINDLETAARQILTLSISKDGVEQGAPITKEVSVAPYQVEKTSFELTVPATPGNYLLKVSTPYGGEEVFSVRDLVAR